MKAIDWMRLSPEDRAKAVEVFGLIKTGSTDVRGGVVISDGYTDADLINVNITKNETRENAQQDGGGTVQGVGSEKAKRTRKGKNLSVPTK